jgi:hypothetical protein
MKPMFSSVLIAALFVVFSLIAASGIWLTIASVTQESQASTEKGDSPSKVDIALSGTGVKVKLTTAIPGLVVFVMGTAGLLLLTIRVPVRQVTGYTRPPKLPPGAVGLMAPSMMPTKPIVSERVEHIPLLLWWLVRDQGRAIRAKPV